jgi:hypothetical protein
VKNATTSGKKSYQLCFAHLMHIFPFFNIEHLKEVKIVYDKHSSLTPNVGKLTEVKLS